MLFQMNAKLKELIYILKIYFKYGNVNFSIYIYGMIIILMFNKYVSFKILIFPYGFIDSCFAVHHLQIYIYNVH